MQELPKLTFSFNDLRNERWELAIIHLLVGEHGELVCTGLGCSEDI
jgi:hypothetical protein